MQVVAPAASADIERALWALRGYEVMALAVTGEGGPHVAGVYFAPEPAEGGVQLLVALAGGSRLERAMAADPRVAFMCSPGNPSRWIQGSGHAVLVGDATRRAALFDRLIAHAAGARAFVDDPAALPGIIVVETVKVVEDAQGTPLRVRFGD